MDVPLQIGVRSTVYVNRFCPDNPKLSWWDQANYCPRTIITRYWILTYESKSRFKKVLVSLLHIRYLPSEKSAAQNSCLIMCISFSRIWSLCWVRSSLNSFTKSIHNFKVTQSFSAYAPQNASDNAVRWRSLVTDFEPVLTKCLRDKQVIRKSRYT